MLPAMETPHASLIRDCLAYCERHGIAPSTLGRKAVNNGKLMSRLMNGAQLLPKTEQRVRAFINDERTTQAASNETLTPASPSGS